VPDWRVPLADVVIDAAEIERVADTYRSGWLSMGPRTEELEAALRAYTRSPHVVATANCTAALHLACMACELGEGDEVVVPSLSFVATANAIRYTGATPVFADIAALDSPWLSAAAAEAALTERTKAIMTMSYGGHPGQTDALAELAERRGLLLLEDAAHGLGGSSGRGPLGTIGIAGAYSFFSNKNLPVGEGGALVSRDDAIAERARLLRSHGMTTLTWDRHRGHSFGYDVVDLGFNYRIDEARATLATARLERLDADNVKRGKLDGAYREALADVDGVAPTMPPPVAGASAHHVFTVVLDQGIDRDALRASLAEAGVQTSMHYPPIHLFSIYAGDWDLPLTEDYAGRAVTLPLFPHMTVAQLELVVEALAAAVA
jgi:dTDP-4-amino-4,6-dideoxygalactose transaminase